MEKDQLASMSNLELFGEKRWQELREEEIEYQLDGMSEYLHSEAEERLEACREQLEQLPDELLFQKDILGDLRRERINDLLEQQGCNEK